jgi:uncharacterized protein YqeY
MSVKEQLQADLKDAMRSGNSVRKTVIRGVMTAIKESEQRNREGLAKKALSKHNVVKPQSLDDAEALHAYQQAVDAALAAEDVEALSLLDDADALGVIQKLAKQRQEGIEQAEKAGRADIVEAEAAELAILETYLPQQMTREEVEAVARTVIKEMGATEMRDMGRVMGPLMEKLRGQADGKLVSDVVRSLLSG